MNKINIKLLALIAVSAVTLISTDVIAMDNKPQTENAMSKELPTDHLTDLQKRVTMEGGTERAFDNEYWDNKAEGIYVDIINGEPLFSSTDKFNSGSGWPSFTCPISESMVDENTDSKFGMTRTEIKSSTSNAHLGHVFNDGPAEKGGLRYCINSASMQFVPKSDLEKEGYGEYLKLFDKK